VSQDKPLQYVIKDLEPEYITSEDDYSGPHGNQPVGSQFALRLDFIEKVSGTPAVRGWWRCPYCHMEFARSKACKMHMGLVPNSPAYCRVLLAEEEARHMERNPFYELTDEEKKWVQAAAFATFHSPNSNPQRKKVKPKSIAQEANDIGAEVILRRILLEHPMLSEENRRILAALRPLHNVKDFLVDLPIGPGIEVRLIDQPQHRLTVRDGDVQTRIFCNMLGAYPRYAFAGFVIFLDIEYVFRYRTDYGHPELEEDVFALPRELKNYSIENLIEAAQ
jgi:hypothetical protein